MNPWLLIDLVIEKKRYNFMGELYLQMKPDLCLKDDFPWQAQLLEWDREKYLLESHIPTFIRLDLKGQALSKYG